MKIACSCLSIQHARLNQSMIATSKGKSRIEREDEEMDDIYGLRSSIDDFIAEDFMRLSNVNSKGGKSLNHLHHCH